MVGYGGTLTIPTPQLVLGEVQIAGSLVGTLDDLAALVRLATAGQVTVRTTSARWLRSTTPSPTSSGAGYGAERS